ncbi:3-dehydroquinate synthase [uncultured Cytophaga sp.]|uniref:3-dehydroquinate synthase n=1 Tax=uncultured Cytophaga sp. TaxID=160238 RepID=UPI002605D4FF|nr:3-dehydroquinate synthase [uncultured Cytophaga sp.]
MASEILFTQQTKQTLQPFLRKYSTVCVLVDENTKKNCLPLLADLFSAENIIEIKSGEAEKTLQTCEKIWSHMTELSLDRKALLVNLGGGVIGDMGGFCASTYKRGIDFIQIPTTLLSQVDASVGGKLGIDFTHNGNTFKNHVGVFNVPQAVIIDPTFLKTLDPKEVRSGFAEIIKHCLIADKSKWNEIKTNTDLSKFDWMELAKHSVGIKEKITLEDPLEKGLRKILNFGHTVGHAIESHFLFIPNKRLLHGEAIAAGMICESWLSVQKGFISMNEHTEIEKYILSVYGKTSITSEEIDVIVPLTIQDKKNESGAIQFSLLEKIGTANFNISLTAAEITASLHYYASL